LLIPASLGVHGPGEMTIFSGLSAAISLGVISSLPLHHEFRAELAEVLTRL
jgi:hypothetical protein